MVGDILQPTHLLLILVVALLVLGPKRLPEVGRSLGNSLRDFRSALDGVHEHREELSSAIRTSTTPDPPVVAPSPEVVDSPAPPGEQHSPDPAATPAPAPEPAHESAPAPGAGGTSTPEPASAADVAVEQRSAPLG